MMSKGLRSELSCMQLGLVGSLVKEGQLLKERICSCWSKFLLLRVERIRKGFFDQEARKKVAKLARLS